MLASVSRRFVRCGARCGRRGGPRRRGVGIGSGSGRRSLAGCRARTRPVSLGCRRRWGRGGSVRLAGCRRSVWLRCRSGICVSWSVRRSRSCMPRAQGCGRWRDGWVVRRRRSRGSCAATLRLAATQCRIERRPRSGTRSGVPAARRSPSSPAMTRCAPTCRTVSPGRSPDPTASWCRDPMCASPVAAMAAVLIGVGRSPGVPSRSRTGCGSISPMMSRCGSLMRPSTRRSTSRDGAPSSESS